MNSNNHPLSTAGIQRRNGDTLTEEPINRNSAQGDATSTGHGASSAELQPGTVIRHYELIRKLGAGGMGIVFLARDVRLGRLVAIKFILKHMGSAAPRFFSEARMTAQCRHENIVVIYDVDELDGRPYMVLEYVQGRTLRDAMTEEKGHSMSAAVALMLPVARALSCAHEMGIVHRDLKPENIMLSDSGQVKVLDFGIAKQISLDLASTMMAKETTAAEDDMRLTPNGALVGTLPYVSPEQWLGLSIDERTDIWAAGLMLFELVTGAHPLDSPTAWDMKSISDLDAPMPSVREKLSFAPALADIIDRCLKKHKDERMGSAKALVEALEQLAESERSAVAVKEGESPVVGLSAFRESRWRPWIGGVIGALGLFVFVVSVLSAQARTRAAEARECAKEAKRRAAEARNATRMASAREHLSDPTLVLALIREIEPAASMPPRWSDLARWAMLQDLAQVVMTHAAPVESAAFSPDGKRIVTASWDKTARVWDAKRGSLLVVLSGHQNWVSGAAWSPNGERIVTASFDKTVRVWNADGTGEPLILVGHEAPVTSAAWNSDGSRIATASRDKTVRVWSADGSGESLVLVGHLQEVESVAWSPDGKRIVSASRDGTARVWNADASGEPRILAGHQDFVCSAAFSPDGRRIVTTSWDKTARVWNADGSGEPLVLAGYEEEVMGASFSPDGKRIVTASWDKTARLWNADGSGKALVLQGHEGGVYSASFSPDGRFVATASLDRTARIWNVDGSGKPLILQPPAPVGTGSMGGGGAYTPDGRYLVTISDDEAIRVWNTDGSQEPAILRVSELYYPTVVAFSPNGTHIVTGSHEKKAPSTGKERYRVRVWPVFKAFAGNDDPELWLATRYCPPVEVRVELLGVNEKEAEEQFADCQARVADAFARARP